MKERSERGKNTARKGGKKLKNERMKRMKE